MNLIIKMRKNNLLKLKFNKIIKNLDIFELKFKKAEF